MTEINGYSLHSQSYGATFLQPYGITLSDYLKTLIQGEARVTEVNATENAQGHANALLSEIENMQAKHKELRRQRPANVILNGACGMKDPGAIPIRGL